MHQHLRVSAVRIGALGRLTPVMNQGSVAVRPSGQALAALGDIGVFAHGVFLASGSDTSVPPRRVAVRVSSTSPR